MSLSPTGAAVGYNSVGCSANVRGGSMDPSAKHITINTFLDEWIDRSSWTWPRATAAAAAVLLLLLAVVSYLDGVFHRPFDLGFWRVNLLGPVIIIYTLLAMPIFQRLRLEAILAFRNLVDLSSEEFGRVV